MKPSNLRHHLPNKEPISAQSLAISLGLRVYELLPALYALEAEGRALRISVNESGNVRWKRL